MSLSRKDETVCSLRVLTPSVMSTEERGGGEGWVHEWVSECE